MRASGSIRSCPFWLFFRLLIVSGKKSVFLDGMLGGVLVPGGEAMFNTLVPVRDDLPFDLAAVTVSESFLLPPMSIKKVQYVVLGCNP